MPSGLSRSLEQKMIVDRGNLLVYCSLALIMALAVFFRSQGYFDGSISFWWDEADWAARLLTKPLPDVVKIRPVGYMFFTRLLVKSISTDETVFRLLSYISSIAAVPMVFLIARRLWNSRIVILLAVFLAAFNPNLITFAKEFKPYALEFLVHSGLILLSLIYINSKKTSQLYLLLIYSLLSIFFSYNIVSVFPALYLILLSDAYSSRNMKKFIFLVSAALIICLALYIMYSQLWSGLNFAREEKYWGNKYDVFYLGTKIPEYFKWLAAKYFGLVEDSARGVIFWPALSGLAPGIGLLLVLFNAVGVLAFILEKKFDYLILFLLPILDVILANVLGLWPFGPFRVNLFLTIYFLILTLNGFNFLIRNRNKIISYCGYGIIVLFIILQLPVNLHYYSIKPRDSWNPGQSDVRKVLETIIQFEGARRDRGFINWQTVPVHSDNHAYFATQYYLTYHPNSAEYTKALQNLNVKYVYVLSGVESFQPEGAGTILELLKGLAAKPGIYQGVDWYVLGNPDAIDKIEKILKTMPERVIFKKKFSYGSLVFVLRT